MPSGETVFDGVDEPRLAAHRRLFSGSGLTVLGPPALRPPWFGALRDEARARMLDASWSLTGRSTRGEIEQHNRRARLGAVGRAYLSSEAVASVLYAVTGERLAPSWSASCYTRYVGPGEHMGEHCDKPDTCTYNVLTYLEADWSPVHGPGPGLSLYVFRGDNAATGLAARVSAHANRALLLYGSRQAHLRPALAAGERLLMLAGCFRRR